jgi:hypothetical protein
VEQGVWSVRGLVVPARGQERVQQRVRFDLPREAGSLAVVDFRVRTVGYREAWFSLPRGVTEAGGGRRKRYWVSVERSKPGLYQLPINYFPGLHVRANGVTVTQSSANSHMLVLPLRGGMNLVEIAVCPHPVALGLMAAGLITLATLVGRAWYRSRALVAPREVLLAGSRDIRSAAA